MSEKHKNEVTRVYSMEVMLEVKDTLIAASGLVEAIHHQYAHEGVMSSGALLYIAKTIDRVIDKLDLEYGPATQEDLPF